MVTDAGTREIDHDIDIVQGGGQLVHRFTGGGQRDLVRRHGVPAHESHDSLPAFAQKCRQRTADQSGGTGDGDALPGHGSG